MTKILIVSFCVVVISIIIAGCAQFAVNIELLLRAIFLANVYIVRSQSIVRVRQIRIQFESPHVLGDRLFIIVLLSVEVSQLHVHLGKRIIERH